MRNLNILSGGAAQGLVGSLTTAFQAQTGFGIKGEFGAVGAMADKLRKGTPTDVIILTASIVTQLAEDGLVVTASTADIGKVETALAVRTGDPLVTVNSSSDLRACLLKSDAIYVPDTSASTAGIHVAKVLSKLGIADEVAGRLRIFPNGATAMREMSRSDARYPIGCTQATEIVSTNGVTLSGVLPPGCGLATMYTAGITTSAAHEVEAQKLIALLIGEGQQGQRASAGFIGREK